MNSDQEDIEKRKRRIQNMIDEVKKRQEEVLRRGLDISDDLARMKQQLADDGFVGENNEKDSSLPPA